MRITINLHVNEYDQLAKVAQAERRPLRDQAAWLIAQSLAKLGEQTKEREVPVT